MGDAAVDDGRGADAAVDRLHARLHLGDHAGVEGRHHVADLVRGDLRDDRVLVGVVGVHARDVGQHDEALRLQRDGERRGCRVAVDVVHLAVAVGRDGGDDGNPAGGDQVVQGAGVDRLHVADQPEVDLLVAHRESLALRGEQPAVLAGHPDGERPVLVDQVHQLPADLADEHHPHHIHRLRGGNPKAAAELRGDVQLVEHLRDLRAAAVHDDGAEPHAAKEHDVLGEGALEGVVGHGVAAVLDDDGLPRELGKPRQRLDERRRLGDQLRLPVGKDLRAHVEYSAFSFT